MPDHEHCIKECPIDMIPAESRQMLLIALGAYYSQMPTASQEDVLDFLHHFAAHMLYVHDEGFQNCAKELQSLPTGMLLHKRLARCIRICNEFQKNEGED